MADITPSPNMNLPVPTVGVDSGPDWANNLNASLSVIDGHNHSAGSGVPITPSGLNINADLAFNNANNATQLRSVRFFPQSVPLAGSSPDLGCIYESGVDLYYNDGNGNQIRITQSGSVAGSSGTITGLPSGTASAAYSSSSGTFVFQQATSTAANMDLATVIIRYPGSYPTPSGNYIALQAPSSLATGYAFTLPATTPGTSNALLTSNTSGVLSYTNTDEVTLTASAGVIKVADLGVNTAQLAAGAVTAAKITSGTITGTQIGSNINLAGNLVTENGNALVVAATNASKSLAIVRGSVDSAGNASSGEGFLSIRISTGVYSVSFTAGFSDAPSLSVLPIFTSTVVIPAFTAASSSSFTINIHNLAGVLVDSSFSFIAIAQRG